MKLITIKNKTFTVHDELHFYVAVAYDGTVSSFHNHPRRIDSCGVWSGYGAQVIGMLPDNVPDWADLLYSFPAQEHSAIKLERFNVYGVSDWSESDGEKFEIFIGKEFENEEQAIAAAQSAYSDKTEIIVIKC